TQRYKRTLLDVKYIQTIINVSNEYPIEIQQYIFQFTFSNLIQLQIQPYYPKSTQPSTILLKGDFSFENFYSIYFTNVILMYNVTEDANCSLTFYSVYQQVVLNNIKIQNTNQNSDTDYCNKINLVNSYLLIQNITLDSKHFKNQTYITS
ncbi:hypothetical protein TTHERM_002653527, partial (macronuclear) [Tetrahymena thermophila SB210]